MSVSTKAFVTIHIQSNRLLAVSMCVGSTEEILWNYQRVIINMMNCDR